MISAKIRRLYPGSDDRHPHQRRVAANLFGVLLHASASAIGGPHDRVLLFLLFGCVVLFARISNNSIGRVYVYIWIERCALLHPPLFDAHIKLGSYPPPQHFFNPDFCPIFVYVYWCCCCCAIMFMRHISASFIFTGKCIIPMLLADTYS